MVENTKFAFGTFETDSPRFAETCACPLLQAFGTTQNSADEVERELSILYDEIAVDYFTEPGYTSDNVGIISEEDAKTAWERVLMVAGGDVRDTAIDAAIELGWSDLVEQYR